MPLNDISAITWQALNNATLMLWHTFWSLALGLILSAFIQVTAPREKIEQLLGKPGTGSLFLATLLGAASSSCSYAAAAMGKSLYEKGANLSIVLAFMFAATNLVVELSAVLWTFLGPAFVAAELTGGLLLVLIMTMLVRLTYRLFFASENQASPGRETGERAEKVLQWQSLSLSSPAPSETRQAQESEQIERSPAVHEHSPGSMSAAKLSTSDRLSLAFSGDLNMLYKEVLAGFLIAGILSAAVPADTWAHLFIADRGGIEQAHWLAAIENALIAPLIAMASFVCSVGNIPLASVLWHNGISFGGVIAFIYSDLLIPPILQLYGKYFGRKLSIYISAIMFATIVITALIVDAVFRAFNFIPAQHSGMAMSAMHIELNYTAYLNMVFLAVCVFLFYKSKKARLAAGAEATKSCCQH